jgi:phospholipase/carboxylesterase
MSRPHVSLPGSGTPLLLLLHGTGGDEHDLLPLREHPAPDAPVLSARGTVL